MRYREIIQETDLNESWLKDLTQKINPSKIKTQLKQIRDQLANEQTAAEDMARVYYLWQNNQATQNQLKWANTELLRIIKMLGLSTIFTLPGGSFLLPLLIKLGQKLSIDILPGKIQSLKENNTINRTKN